ncbi:MAG: 3-oxoacyl-ACP reductase family protein [Pirellulales bacterium]
MKFSLQGRVALVTGSSTGLGLGTAQSLGQAGARVVVNYAHNAERAERAMEQLRAAGVTCCLAQGSAVTTAGVDAMFAVAEREFGPVDIVVVNATPDQPQRPIERYDWDFYQEMIDYFIKSPYLLARRALPHMKSQQWGRIINVTSEVFQKSVAPFSAYVAAKGGQVGWSRSMATELAPYGITVNMIAPGWIPTERHDADPQEMKDRYLASVPMRRWGLPQEVGDAAVYLASDEAGFVTGQTLCVNGGNSPW